MCIEYKVVDPPRQGTLPRTGSAYPLLSVTMPWRHDRSSGDSVTRGRPLGVGGHAALPMRPGRHARAGPTMGSRAARWSSATGWPAGPLADASGHPRSPPGLRARRSGGCPTGQPTPGVIGSDLPNRPDLPNPVPIFRTGWSYRSGPNPLPAESSPPGPNRSADCGPHHQQR